MAVERSRGSAGPGEGPILSVRNLQTAFFTEKEVVRAVDGVGFDVETGETVGIVGESGSGKSVTARSIMGLVESPGRVLRGSSVRFHHLPTVREFARRFPKRTVDLGALASEHDPATLFDRSPVDVTPASFGYDDPGEATVADFVAAGYGEELGLVDAADCVFVTAGDPDDPAAVEAGFVEITRLDGEPQRAMRGGKIAMVFQDPLTSLNPVYTVGNQIVEAVELHRGLSGQEAREEAVGLLEAVGIPDARRRLGEYPHQFSGGMQQRAVIAMALACEPELLICDEPTTALDVTIQAQILDLLADVQAERDLAIMFITHDMGVIAEVSDRVNVMYAGEIVETADVASLFAEPKHPYTQGLLRSIPGRNPGETRLPTIEGDVPTPVGSASYCRFVDRCPKAFAACDQVHPANVAVGETPGHTAACLLYPEDLPTDEAVAYHESLADQSGVDPSAELEDEPGARSDAERAPGDATPLDGQDGARTDGGGGADGRDRGDPR